MCYYYALLVQSNLFIRLFGYTYRLIGRAEIIKVTHSTPGCESIEAFWRQLSLDYIIKRETHLNFSIQTWPQFLIWDSWKLDDDEVEDDGCWSSLWAFGWAILLWCCCVRPLPDLLGAMVMLTHWVVFGGDVPPILLDIVPDIYPPPYLFSLGKLTNTFSILVIYFAFTFFKLYGWAVEMYWRWNTLTFIINYLLHSEMNLLHFGFLCCQIIFAAVCLSFSNYMHISALIGPQFSWDWFTNPALLIGRNINRFWKLGNCTISINLFTVFILFHIYWIWKWKCWNMFPLHSSSGWLPCPSSLSSNLPACPKSHPQGANEPCLVKPILWVNLWGRLILQGNFYLGGILILWHCLILWGSLIL